METKRVFAKKLAIAVFTLVTLLAFSLSAQAQQKVPPPNRPLDPLLPSACDAVAGNLVVNCGFETGDFTSWTLSGNQVFIFVDYFYPHTGTYEASLGSIGGLGCISQTLATIPNQPYLLSFWLLGNRRPNNFQVFWAGVEVSGDMVNMPDFDYTRFFLGGQNELIGSGGDTLTFCAQNDLAYFYLDDIVVQPL